MRSVKAAGTPTGRREPTETSEPFNGAPTRTDAGRRARGRPRSDAAQPRLLALLLCYSILLSLAPAAASATGMIVRASPSPTVAMKYDVVGEGSEYLFDIAARTLGDGRRYLEIFQLNEGRLQPDGRRMTDPAVLSAGWILQLPADAAGVDVHQGPLPPVDQSRPPQSSQAVQSTGNLFGDLARLLGLATLLVVLVLVAGRFSRRLAQARVARSGRSPARQIESADRAPARAAPARSHRPLILAEFVFDAQVKNGSDNVTVRLTGATSASRRPYAWVTAGSPRPPGPALVAVGVRGDDVLLVDLSFTPDVVTLIGPSDGLGRMVHSIATQLRHGGLAVTIVGEVAGAVPLVGARVVSSYSDLPSALGMQPGPRPSEPGWPEVIFGPAAHSDGLPVHGPRRVLIVVGPTLRARWSIEVSAETVSAGLTLPGMSRHQPLHRPLSRLATEGPSAKNP